MPVFEKTCDFEFPVEGLFQYHANPGALSRLVPTWQHVDVEKRSDSLAVGSEVVLVMRMLGLPMRWLARHTQLEVSKSFTDVQVSGPFRSWQHEHLFSPLSATRSRLVDRIQFDSGLWGVSGLAHRSIASMLETAFEYRHQTTAADLAVKTFLESSGNRSRRALRIGVTGSTGMIGRRLVELIAVMGYQPVCIVRPASRVRRDQLPINAQVVSFDDKQGFSDTSIANGLDAVIHLGGKGIASARWSKSVKQELIDSRVKQTDALVRHLGALDKPPASLICASGVGFYGERGNDPLVEDDPAGDDFLASMALRWEDAAKGYERFGRVAIGRLGVVLLPLDGALKKMLLPFSMGMGGPLGSGRQYWSWIDIDDAISAFLFLAIDERCSGPYNLVSPEAVTNREFSRTLAHVMRRPSLIPTPAFAMRIALGEMADALLLTSTRAIPSRLLQAGFPFRGSTLEGSLRRLLGKPVS